MKNNASAVRPAPNVRAGTTLAAALLLTLLLSSSVMAPARAQAVPAATAGLHPNLQGQTQQPLRYRPDGADFVIDNGAEFFNRSLYGGNTAFRVDGGDKPEFLLYLPGRGGNLRLALRTPSGAKWLHDAASIVTRYRPGELRYDIRDPAFGAGAVIHIVALAYAQTEGLIVRADAQGLPDGAELVWAYGGASGKRGVRDGDIGTERVPISDYFQFQPALADGNTFTLNAQGFALSSKPATIVGVTPPGAAQAIADAALWNDLSALLKVPAVYAGAAPAAPIVIGRAALHNDQPLLLSLQRVAGGAPAQELAQYAEVTAAKTIDKTKEKTAEEKPGVAKKTLALAAPYTAAQLPAEFTRAQAHFAALRNKITVDTPDPWLNASVGALNVVADALWDEADQAIMHGSIAWRTKLLGWRGPYVLDALGWHERARGNLNTWTIKQNTAAIPGAAAATPADAKTNLARNEAGLHSNGDLSNSHYDMNMVFIDALLRHLQWTGDVDYARAVWPVIERHLAWEKRLFRRTFGPDKLPLYEAYAAIWASDDLYYNGGGVSYASAYNVYANRGAARIARLLGKDGSTYEREAALIEQGMRTYLWMPEQGAYAEFKDLLGAQRQHPAYGLWTFYHTVDSQAASPREAWQMASALQRRFQPIPVHGPGVPSDAPYHVLPTSDWMPYSWSINNVVMGENLHTALALWQAGRADEAWLLAKSALLASMYMGISPGNVGTMNYLDAYRRESQRDFGDGAGVTSRAIVEGLFGIAPDALAHTLTIRPGFPSTWAHASLQHPDLSLHFKRGEKVEEWEVTQTAQRFDTVNLRLPAAYNRVAGVTVNGKAVAWKADPDAVGRPQLLVSAPLAQAATIIIRWAGEPIAAATMQAGAGDAPAKAADTRAGFVARRSGDFSWLAEAAAQPAPPEPSLAQTDWKAARPGAIYQSIPLAAYFNDSVTQIFKPGKYLAPRSPHVSLSLPSQGIGAWAGHVNAMADIDDSGLRQVAAANNGRLRLANGVEFATPTAPAAANIVFTSQWDNYPKQVRIPLDGQASHAYMLMAGSTNFMQSRMDNGEIIISYTDGSTQRLALNNPVNWWPIEQDYFIDDYQFNRPGPRPPRVDLKTGRVRYGDEGAPESKGMNMIPGGAATLLDLPLDANKTLSAITLRTLANDVVIGLMGLSLERPAAPK